MPAAAATKLPNVTRCRCGCVNCRCHLHGRPAPRPEFVDPNLQNRSHISFDTAGDAQYETTSALAYVPKPVVDTTTRIYSPGRSHRLEPVCKSNANKHASHIVIADPESSMQQPPMVSRARETYAGARPSERQRAQRSTLKHHETHLLVGCDTTAYDTTARTDFPAYAGQIIERATGEGAGAQFHFLRLEVAPSLDYKSHTHHSFPAHQLPPSHPNYRPLPSSVDLRDLADGGAHDPHETTSKTHFPQHRSDAFAEHARAREQNKSREHLLHDPELLYKMSKGQADANASHSKSVHKQLGGRPAKMCENMVVKSHMVLGNDPWDLTPMSHEFRRSYSAPAASPIFPKDASNLLKDARVMVDPNASKERVSVAQTAFAPHQGRPASPSKTALQTHVVLGSDEDQHQPISHDYRDPTLRRLPHEGRSQQMANHTSSLFRATDNADNSTPKTMTQHDYRAFASEEIDPSLPRTGLHQTNYDLGYQPTEYTSESHLNYQQSGYTAPPRAAAPSSKERFQIGADSDSRDFATSYSAGVGNSSHARCCHAIETGCCARCPPGSCGPVEGGAGADFSYTIEHGHD